MECKHGYFHYVDGVLKCTQCGLTPEEIRGEAAEDKVEDKVMPPPENKTGEPETPQIIPPEVKREPKVVKKRSKRKGSRR